MEFYDIYPNSNDYDNNSIKRNDNTNNSQTKPIVNSNSSTNESLSQEEWDDLSNIDQYNQSNKKIKKSSTANTTIIISRLKNEIAILREAVDIANGSDIEIMQTKLRIANADILKLRERNNDYKSRIQLLEQRLFDTIQSNATTNNFNNTNNDDDDEFKDADYYDLNDNNDNNYKNSLKSLSSTTSSIKPNYEKLERKCNFLQKLLSSLELRLQESQKIIDDQKKLLYKKDSNSNSNGSINTKNNTNNSKKTMKKKDPTLKTLYIEIEPLVQQLSSGISSLLSILSFLSSLSLLSL